MPRFTRVRNLGLAAATAAVALGVFVSTSLGSSSSRRHSAGAITLQRIDFRARPVRGARSAGTGTYVVAASVISTLAARHYTFGDIKCPTSHPEPINGEFGSNSQYVYVASSNPYKGGWFMRITNTGSTAAKVYVGTVCAS